MTLNGKEASPTIGNPKSFYIQWHFLAGCNLRCCHCYQEDFNSEPLPLDMLHSIARDLDNALGTWRRLGRISLTGGEPFLLPEILFELLDFFESSANVEWIGVLTNGTLITPSTAKRLGQYSKLKEIQVSLDGATSLTHDRVRGYGSFRRVLDAIKVLKAHGLNTSLMFTMNRMNVHEALDVLDLAVRLGINAITLERVVSEGRAKTSPALELDSKTLRDVFQEIAKQKKAIEETSGMKIRTSRPLWCLCEENLGGFCPAGLFSLCILHDGTVLPCRRLPIPLGNVLEEGLFRIWYGSDLLWQLRNRKAWPSRCATCRFLGKCGGCRAMAFARFGDYLSSDPDCWYLTEQDNERNAAAV